MTSSDTRARDADAAVYAEIGSAYYPVLVAVFTGLVIISNVTATKGRRVRADHRPLVDHHRRWLYCFPLTYVIGDVLSEVYGFRATRRAIFIGFAMQALAAFAFWVTMLSACGRLLHQSGVVRKRGPGVTQLIVAGLSGFIVGQTINAWVVVAIKAHTKERHL